MRRLAVVVALVAGLAVAIWLTLDSGDGPVPEARVTSTSTSSAATTTSTLFDPTTTAPPPPSTTPSISPEERLLLAWTRGRLPKGFSRQVAGLEQVTGVTTVRGGMLHLVDPDPGLPGGFVIPVEALAFDPITYPSVRPGERSAWLQELGRREVVLGSTSARLRPERPGDGLEVADGPPLEAAGVAEDGAVGGGEVAMTTDTGEEVGVDTPRYLLLRYTGDRALLEGSIRALLPGDVAVRVRAPGETQILRHADSVLPQAAIKDVFGEFSYRATETGFEMDTGWQEESIITSDVPLLGQLRCHRDLVPSLTGAMEELIDRGLDTLIDRSQGCFNPRFVAGQESISRHAWGAAVDINIGTGSEGRRSIQDPRLLEVMERWGFTSGHDWLLPDPGHFEYIRPPGEG